jgi:transposase InsO family protein
MESFYSIIKREEIYRKQYKDYNDIKNSINEYIVFYNDKRPHKALGYLSPTEYENSYNSQD